MESEKMDGITALMMLVSNEITNTPRVEKKSRWPVASRRDSLLRTLERRPISPQLIASKANRTLDPTLTPLRYVRIGQHIRRLVEFDSLAISLVLEVNGRRGVFKGKNTVLNQTRITNFIYTLVLEFKFGKGDSFSHYVISIWFEAHWLALGALLDRVVSNCVKRNPRVNPLL
ncbi:hypothetical protein BDW72DRAFT_174018 [Aspergillus terricola var. indicus]